MDISEVANCVGIISLHDGGKHYNQISFFEESGTEPEVTSPDEVTGEQDSLKLQIVGVGDLFDGMDDAVLEESLDRSKALLSPNPAPITFPIGSVVKVLADTRPGVSSRHAHSFMATIIAMTEDGQYDVSPTVENKRRRRVSEERLQVACIDGLDSLSRLGSPNAIAKKMAVQAQSALTKSQVKGEEVKRKLVASRRKAEAERINNVKLTRAKKEAAKAHQRSRREVKQLLNDSYLRAEEIKRKNRAEIKAIREAKNSETKSFLAKEMAIHVEKRKAHEAGREADRKDWKERSRALVTERKKMRASFVQKLKSANKAASKAAKVASKAMEQAKSDLDEMKEKAESNLAALKNKATPKSRQQQNSIRAL